MDMECDDENTYYLLTIGLKLLLVSSLISKGDQNDIKMSGSQQASSWFLSMWQSADTNDLIQASFEEKKKNKFFSVLSSLHPSINISKYFTSSAAPNNSVSSCLSLPPAQFLGWKSAGTQIWARLKLAGLEVKCVFSHDLKRVILKVRT